MSFGNSKRADPHQHFRTESGYRGPHDHSAGLTEAEAKRVLGKRWGEFDLWTAGQTIGLCPRGCSLYYQQDVERFLCGGKVWD